MRCDWDHPDLQLGPKTRMGVLVGLLMLLGAVGQAGAAVEERTYFGVADASAAVFLDAAYFVVADDESNTLNIYHRDKTAGPAAALDLSTPLAVLADSPEADIEAAAKIDDRIYWITSHGRSKTGKLRPNRYRFFGTQIIPAEAAKTPPRLIPVGVPCQNLVQQLLQHPSAIQQTLANATQLDKTLSKKERQRLAPKENGLNIEGLMVYPPGKSLLIGLRNPLYTPAGNDRPCAIVVELKNPADVLTGQPAVFGRLLVWDLDKRGIRGMTYSAAHKAWFILAGDTGRGDAAATLYQWNGDFNAAPQKRYTWPKSETPFNPEGITPEPGTDRLWVVSDDGTVKIAVCYPEDCIEGELLDDGRCPNKYLRHPAQKRFRVQPLTPAAWKQP